MELTKWFSKFLPGNKRAIIFLVDIMIALFIVVLILSFSVFSISRSETSPSSKLQAHRLGQDIFAVLDYTDSLRTFDQITIRSTIDTLLPLGYSLDFTIICNNRVYDSRQDVSSDFVFSGERVFIDEYFHACMVRYWIWLA